MWIAAFHPDLPLDLAYRRWPSALAQSLRDTVPLAVTESRRVRWASPCAQQAGILTGMTDTSAHARAANIVLLPRDPESERKAMTEAALWALHFTPQVAIRPGGLVLDITASLRLFGGVRAIVERLRDGLVELGLSPQIAAAPTATAAWWLAQSRDGIITDNDTALEALPALTIASLAPHAETLAAMGCRTIGQFRRLPRAGISRRFGKAALTELDRATGAEPEPQAWYEPPETFCQRVELGARVETTELLLVSAKRLLMQMTGFLSARHSAVTSFSLLLHHETVRNNKSPMTRVDIALGTASRDLDHLTLLMKEHLGKVELQSSVIELTLEAGGIERQAAANTELFPSAAGEAESVGRLIERLVSRLGPEAVHRIRTAADYRPERCSVALPANVPASARRKGEPSPALDFPPRPTWLLKKPIPLLTRNNKPFYVSPLSLVIGPERIESGWWDDQTIARDYFVAENSLHQLLWVYRERIGAADEEPGWFLHGFYA